MLAQPCHDAVRHRVLGKVSGLSAIDSAVPFPGAVFHPTCPIGQRFPHQRGPVAQSFSDGGGIPAAAKGAWKWMASGFGGVGRDWRRKQSSTAKEKKNVLRLVCSIQAPLRRTQNGWCIGLPVLVAS